MLRLTGEVADGWLGTSFVPEGAADAYFAHLDEGLVRSGRSRADLDVCQGAEVAFAPDEDALRAMVAGRKKELAFSLGGMGSVRSCNVVVTTSRSSVEVQAGHQAAPGRQGTRPVTSPPIGCSEGGNRDRSPGRRLASSPLDGA